MEQDPVKAVYGQFNQQSLYSLHLLVASLVIAPEQVPNSMIAPLRTLFFQGKMLVDRIEETRLAAEKAGKEERSAQ